MHTFEGADTMEKTQAIRSRAHQLFVEQVDWAVFFREILSVNGIVQQMYPDQDARSQFEESDEYKELNQMLGKLRDRAGVKAPPQDTTRVITVRLPKSLHESLKEEAHTRHTSMNQLCIAKLLQTVDEQLIPGGAAQEATA